MFSCGGFFPWLLLLERGENVNRKDSNIRELQRQLLPLYQKWGLCMIPLRFKEKTPALPSWQRYQKVKPESGELFEWFGSDTPKNVGIVCGKVSSNLVVLDCDTEDAWADIIRYCNDHGIDLYQTPQVKTARGFHIWIRLRNPPPSRRIAGLDIQSEGKYVVAPPSIHPTGVRYKFLNPDVSEILEFDSLADLGIQEEPQVSQGRGKTPYWVTEALKGAAEGERDNTATRLAGYFKGKDLPLNVTSTILKDWTFRCQQPPDTTEAFTPEDAEKCVRSVYRYGEPIEEPEEESVRPIPKFPEGAWVGLFWDYRDLVGNTTEASDTYHYASVCQVMGTTLGRRLFVYHATRLFPNFYICLVGRSGVTRKDTSWRRASDILHRLHSEQDKEDPVFDILHGLGSSEGLLDALSGEGKVRLLVVAELLSLLAKAKQEALSNIIPQLSELYDCPDRVNPKIRQRVVDCKKPFLSIIAGTTYSWLQKALTERDIYGGFANRWMYIWGLPKGPLPNPLKVDQNKRNSLVAKVNDVRSWAGGLQNGGELVISQEAGRLFDAYYRDYYARCLAEGLIPTLIVRVQDFVWKLTSLYAAMDFSAEIKPQHLEPAILVGNYLEASVAEVFRTFSSTRGRKTEDKLLSFLHTQGKGTPISKRDTHRALGLSATELEQAAQSLAKIGVIKYSTSETKKGRKVACYEAT